LKRLPIRLRLTLAFAAAMAVLLTAVGAFLYIQLGRSLTRSLDQGLRARGADIAALVGQSDSGLREAPGPGRAEANLAQVLDLGGRVVDATRGADRRPLLSPGQLARASRSALFVDRNGEERLLASPVDAQGRRLVIVVGASLEPRAEALSALQTELSVGAPIALALACALGYALAAAALRPIEAIRSRAAGISAAERGARLPVPAARDEVSRLAETLNALLGRLEEALERERRFVADASHELRTPLALLKAEIELALETRQPAPRLRAALRSAGEEVDRLTQLAEDLLQLARLEGGRLPVRLAEIDACELAEAVARRFSARATGAGRSIVTRGEDLLVHGDRLRLEQALVNLVENALRHGDGEVEIEGRTTADGSVALRVRDHGNGFPPDYLDRAVDPFSRVDAARTGRGSGLGLAIVAAIVDAHAGAVEVENAPGGGAVVTITLPRRPPQPAAPGSRT